MTTKQGIFYSLLLLILFTLTRCGKDKVCVMGMGDCSVSGTSTQTQTQTGSTDLNLTSDSTVIKINDKATFKATGGTKPYQFQMYQGLGYLIESTKSEDTQQFQAPAAATISAIRVYDAKNNYKTLSITVEE